MKKKKANNYSSKIGRRSGGMGEGGEVAGLMRGRGVEQLGRGDVQAFRF
jgi:hypothetical protein